MDGGANQRGMQLTACVQTVLPSWAVRNNKPTCGKQPERSWCVKLNQKPFKGEFVDFVCFFCWTGVKMEMLRQLHYVSITGFSHYFLLQSIPKLMTDVPEQH